MSKLLKIGTAFFAGVLVALAAAFLYVKATGVKPVSPAIAVAPANPEPPVTAKPVAVPASPVPKPPEVQPDQTVVPVPVSREPVRPVVKRHPVIRRPQLRDRILIAQNTPPASPPAVSLQRVSAPTPAAAAPVPAGPGPQYDSPPPAAAPDQPASPASNPALDSKPQPLSVTLEAGTPLPIRLGETISTDTNYTGDTFRGTLDTPIIRDGYIIADRGSRVLGTIVTAHKAGRMSGAPELTLALKEINTTDGQRVTVETNTVTRTGPSSSGMNTAKVAGGAALGAIIGAIAGGGKGAAIGAGAGGGAGAGAVMLGHAKPAVIASESQLTFRLAQPVTITEKLN
jgi:hypothetical protein